MGKRYRKNNKKESIVKVAATAAVIGTFFIGGYLAYPTVSKLLFSDKPVIENKNNPVQQTPTPDKDVKVDAKPQEQDQVQPPAAISETNVIISAVGDCTIGTDEKFYKPTSLPVMVQNNGGNSSYLFSNVAHIFQEDDITIANLETTFTESTVKKDKGTGRVFHFKGHPSLAESLVTASIEGVNLSNNHIYDYGAKGFSDTIETLKNYNIDYFGEGHKWIKEVNGIKFGFLGYQGWVYSKELVNKITKDTEALKAEADVIIISFHWGEEGSYTPNATQTKLAHFAIDSGADLVVGHHPHVIQGIEEYKGRYINYSLGNFCFGGNSNPKDKDTLVFQADFKFTDKKLTSLGIRAIPCSVSSLPNSNDYRPTPLAGDAKIKMLQKLNKYNINLARTIDDNFSYIEIK